MLATTNLVAVSTQFGAQVNSAVGWIHIILIRIQEAK